MTLNRIQALDITMMLTTAHTKINEHNCYPNSTTLLPSAQMYYLTRNKDMDIKCLDITTIMRGECATYFDEKFMF